MTQEKEIFVETDLTDFENIESFEKFTTNIGVVETEQREEEYSTPTK
jgi:hypothetical protein